MGAEFGPVTQALLGTLFTWGMTAAGAALVFVLGSTQRKILDASLGFAAGVMTAASYWSLLAPAVELAENDGAYGKLAFIPVGIGFVLGSLFVYAADVFMPQTGGGSPYLNFAMSAERVGKSHSRSNVLLAPNGTTDTVVGFDRPGSDTTLLQRRRPNRSSDDQLLSQTEEGIPRDAGSSWHRILLLIIAIVVHNIPEGLAVGVGFGAIGRTPSATYENARNLAIGIGLQNFPEGLAVSLPLRGAGFSRWKSFWYGQLSGMVEPIAGVAGAFSVSLAEPLLPYALAFAAGAMIYVVFDDIIPEAHSCGNGKLSSLAAIVGFVVMMALDVGLG